jgi:antitoxin (DNA-binding transcriptional repressor) of toxin-antitoxin stability system
MTTNWEATVSSYSVAQAEAGLPSLINPALAGEEVIVTRHGKPMVELRPAAPAPSTTPSPRMSGCCQAGSSCRRERRRRWRC